MFRNYKVSRGEILLMFRNDKVSTGENIVDVQEL
jgi:hypothetical protein